MIEFLSPTLYWLTYIGDIICSFTFEFLNQSLTDFVELFQNDLNGTYFIFDTFFYNEHFVVNMNPLGINDIITGLLGDIVGLILMPADLLLGGNAPLFAVILTAFILYSFIFMAINYIWQTLLPFN